MAISELPTGTLEYLRGRFERGNPVLFTGAGFSRGAFNRVGTPIPSTFELRDAIWSLNYPSTPVDKNSTLADVYDAARSRHATRLQQLLEQLLTVDRANIPDYYRRIFELPWWRIYTLNVDDLATAVNETTSLPRPLVTLSPLTPLATLDRVPARRLEVVQLNGRLSDGVNRMTFSSPQYGLRFGSIEPLYAHAAVELLSAPVVYMGTTLDEDLLWQHVQLRKSSRGKDLRRRSFLVVPELPKPRIELLEREYHVEQIPLNVEQFTRDVLSGVGPSAKKGHSYFAALALSEGGTLREIPRAAELARRTPSSPQSEYLLGATPTWNDFAAGRVAAREIDADLLRNVLAAQLEPGRKQIQVVTGTAGSGKTSVGMRTALALVSKGFDVGWLDAEADISPAAIRDLMSKEDHPGLLFLDDADRYGNDLANIAMELSALPSGPLIIVALRSGAVARLADRFRTMKVNHSEIVMPNLSDRDIDALLNVLTTEKRLGTLRGKSRSEQIREFEIRADRQILVAMLEATSGKKLSVKISEELEQLPEGARYIYAVVSIATAMRAGLTKEQLLVAVGGNSNEALQVIEDLTRRLLINQRSNGEYRSRHRVVGERVLDALVQGYSLLEPLKGLLLACAVHAGPNVPRNAPSQRLLRQLTNHDWLRRMISPSQAKELMGTLEQYLSWDHQYFLQRGSLELECGDDDLAENFLNQAAAMQPNDLLVQTELAYLRLKQAVSEPNGVASRELLEDGQDLLKSVILTRARFDAHQYAIYAKQTLLWSRRSDISQEDRDEALAEALRLLEDGREFHPSDNLLRELSAEIQTEQLGIGWRRAEY